jgi:outer membrane protein TolC
MADRSIRPRRALTSLATAGFILLLAGAPRAAAPSSQAPSAAPVRALKLSEALAYAATHQPRIVAARARIAAAQADAAIPRAQWLPTVSAAAELVVGTTNNSTATPISTGGLDLPRIGGTPMASPGSLTPSPTTLVGIGVSQEIFDFGRIAAQSAALDASVVAERHQSSAVELDIAFAIESAYFAVQAAKAIVVAAEGAYARATAHRDLAKAGVDAGLRPPIEMTRAEADRMRFDVGRIRARGGLEAAQVQLAAAVGADDAALDAADEAGATTAGVTSLEAAIKQASSRDPLLLEALARVKEQEARTRAIKAETRPNLWLTSTFSGRAGGATPTSGEVAYGGGWIPSVPNWDVGLVLGWRIFDGTVLARADASRAREQVRRAELDGVRQQEIAAVQRAYVAGAVARDAIGALTRSREAAQANYAQVEARFKTGLATSVELADAEGLRTEAEIQEALGRFEVERTRAALGRAVGENAWTSRTR